MSELQPLDIVDDRTLEQIREDGDEWVSYGYPYIVRGLCAVCGETATEPNHVCLIKLTTPCECETHLLVQEPQKCTGLAHWMLNVAASCDECILDCVERLPDNGEWLRPALADIAGRQQEARERRRLFFAAMRHPEMRMLRLALRHLDWDCGVDWREIQKIEMEPYAPECWMMTTGKFLVVSVNVSPEMTYEDFILVWLHEDGNPECKCEFCEAERRAIA